MTTIARFQKPMFQNIWYQCFIIICCGWTIEGKCEVWSFCLFLHLILWLGCSICINLTCKATMVPMAPQADWHLHFAATLQIPAFLLVLVSPKLYQHHLDLYLSNVHVNLVYCHHHQNLQRNNLTAHYYQLKKTMSSTISLHTPWS